jgi:urease accessory protein
MSEPLLLSRRLAPEASGPTPPEPLLVLSLSAAERQRLRGHGRSVCGHDLLLQLPRGGGPLQPQEQLAGDDGVPRVRVEAAPEALLRVRSDDPFTLLRAAYHLGNRHVALELRQGELRLLQDSVLADLLRGLGVSVEAMTAPFQPESGAYAAGHGHAHSHKHDHGGH